MSASTDKALVVLSGGQDSTTCLYWTIDRFGSRSVSTVTFDYGQRHRIELDCARQVAESAGVSNVVLPIDTFAALGGDALTDESVDVNAPDVSDLPATFVPGRNLIFLTFAAAYAWRRGIGHLVTGVAQTDYSGYPDCREPTIRAVESSISLGMDRDIRIHTPLMNLSKKETVELAVRLGALEAMALTHTCYRGQRPPCGDCEACRLRTKGFAEAGVVDPLLSRK
jgi:7-cyano-7-deazaguanine synthase